MKKLNLVQILKAVAIIFVMLGHLNIWFDIKFNYDWFNMGSWERTGGVDLFFVISGFMITYIYSKYIGEPNKSFYFLKKRTIKIIPMYWLVTISAASLFFIFPQLGDESDRSMGKIIESLLFVHPNPTLAVGWSLSHVVLFYVIFSFVISKPKITVKIIGAWVFITFLYIFGVYPFTSFNSILFSVNNLEILSGSLLALYFRKIDAKYVIPSLILSMTVFLFVWADNHLSFIGIEENLARPVLYCLASLLILFSIAKVDTKKEIKVPSAFAMIGDASYSIFLTHGPLIQFYILVFEKLKLIGLFGNFFSMLIIAFITILSGIAFHIIIEKPVINILSKRISVIRNDRALANK